MKAMLALLVWLVLVALARPATAGAPEPKPWTAGVPGLSQRVMRGDPLVIHVIVPLCHNAQIVCGDHGLGTPDRPSTNLYWGALYGARRFFERKDLDWQAIPQVSGVAGVLERAVFRRSVPGKRWHRRAPVEQVVVLDAIDGNLIDAAVDDFFRSAASGAEVVIDGIDGPRRLPVAAVGYAGHNRLMDGKKLPDVQKDGKPIPSFVLACESGPYFGDALLEAGSEPLVTTRALMAPEGYVIEAMVRALGDNATPPALRRAVVAAYAKWQRLGVGTANRIFTPARTPPSARSPSR
jgi:hypothetical protein